MMEYRDCNAQNKWSFLPFFHRLGPCRNMYDRWINCQSNREFEIREKRRSSLTAIEGDGYYEKNIEQPKN
jgi:hypothetical protein